MKITRILAAVTALSCCLQGGMMSYAIEAAVMPSVQEIVTDTSADEAYRAELESVCGIIKDYIRMTKLTKLDCSVSFGSTEEFRYIEVYGGAYYGDAEAESQMQDVKRYCEAEGFTNRCNIRFSLPLPLPEGEPVSSAPDDDTQRVFVVDDATGELMHMEDGQTYSVSFHTGYAVEFALTDGTFAWGTMWGPESEWDYNTQNPYVIDTSEFVGGFGVDGYEVVDIDLPEGYFLPDDYLETIEYDNDATDIYIRLKKTLPGDVNGDGVFSAADLILLQKWLLNVPGTQLADWRAADFCEDGVLDVFDLSMMKRELLMQDTDTAPVSLEYTVIDEGISSVTNENHDGYAGIAYTKDELLETILRVENLTYTEGLSELVDGHFKKLSDDQAVIVVYSGGKAGSAKFILDDVVREQNGIKVYSRILIDPCPTPDYVSSVMLLAVNRADVQGVNDITLVNTRIQEE